MAIILYSNAILENMRPENLVFTEDEILSVFNENYHTIHSKRIKEVPNTWAVWASMDDPPSNEYNMIGSDIVDFDVDSPLMLIHDGEINPNWNATDPLQYGYDEFLKRMSIFVNDIAKEAVQEKSYVKSSNESGSLISLTQLGITVDKKLLFSFDPDNQANTFYSGESFDNFSTKILEYLMDNFESNMINKKPFTIFDDNKTVVIVDDDKVENTLDRILHKFQAKEDYESCVHVNSIIKKWKEKINGADVQRVKKRGRPKKDK